MALTVTVTPNETWPAGTKITLARLRNTAKPAVSVTGSVTGSDISANSITRDRVKHEAFFYGTDSGTAAALAVNDLSPQPASLVNGLQVIFKALNDCAASATLNVNTLGAKKIYRQSGTLLAANDIRANQLVHVLYNTSLDSAAGGWELISAIANDDDQYAATAGTGNAYTVTLDPAPKGYYAGLTVRLKTDRTNTGAVTLNVNALGAKDVRKFGDTVLAAGDLLSGQVYLAVYDGTNFQLLDGARNVSLADYAADAGASDAYAITLDPEVTAYVTGMVVRFKANTANTGAATLNVNALGAKTIKKSFNVDLSDNDIKAGQLVEVIYDGTNFQLLSPAANEFKTLSAQALPAAAGTLTFAHGLGARPTMVRVVLVCATAEQGFAQNDELELLSTFAGTTADHGHLPVWSDATNVNIRFSTQPVKVNHPTSDTEATLTRANWTAKIYVK